MTAASLAAADARCILACDVGGTKTDVALFEPAGTTLHLVRRETYTSRDYARLDEIVAAFVGLGSPPLLAAGFGVAGPVLAGRARTTNLPWTIDGAELARCLGLRRVSLVNDVEAQLWSVLGLDTAGRVELQPGAPDAGNLAVIAAGTGLGYAALIRGEGSLRSLASEGGHADFSPTDDVEIELFRWLRRKYDHVSVERVVSGPGLFNVYQFLRAQDPGAEPRWLAAALKNGDPPGVVAQAALEGRCSLAERAVLVLLGAYGAEAGNWALRTMSTGGIWLGGGVARKLLVGPPGTSSAWRAHATEVFLTHFHNKGRLSSLVRMMPVGIVISDVAALQGVGRFAWSEARPTD